VIGDPPFKHACKISLSDPFLFSNINVFCWRPFCLAIKKLTLIFLLYADQIPQNWTLFFSVFSAYFLSSTALIYFSLLLHDAKQQYTTMKSLDPCQLLLLLLLLHTIVDELDNIRDDLESLLATHIRSKGGWSGLCLTGGSKHLGAISVTNYLIVTSSECSGWIGESSNSYVIQLASQLVRLSSSPRLT